MADDIPEGQPHFSIAKQIHRFVAEGRKGCEAAQYSDDQKRPGLRGNDASMIGQFGEKANQCASHKIDGQGAEWKLNTLAELLRIAAHKVAQDGADEPASADEEQCTQDETLCKM